MQEIESGAKKNVNDKNYCCTSPQLIGHRCLFREVSVKEWVMRNNNISIFMSTTKC